MVQELLQGTRPPRPLFLPIVFRMGARLENLPLREFLGNATKISNSLRQIRGHLRADGISCYFDPNLEAEALGATVEWHGDSAHLTWPNASRNESAPELRTAEEAVKSGRVPVAIDVIKRLAALMREGTLLTAGVTGPFTLATKIIQDSDVSTEILEHAASVTTAISSALAEAGANVVLIREEKLPALPAEQFENWTSLLAPTFNVIRFYQALPVLQFADSDSVDRNREAILQHTWDCVLTIPIGSGDLNDLNAAGLGIALPASEDTEEQEISGGTSGYHPVLITTVDDVPPTADIKRLTKIFEEVRR